MSRSVLPDAWRTVPTGGGNFFIVSPYPCGTHCWGDLRVRLYHTNLGLRTVVVRWTSVYEKGPVLSLNAVTLGADNDSPSHLLIKSLPSKRPVITRRSKNFESLKVHSRRPSWCTMTTLPACRLERQYKYKDICAQNHIKRSRYCWSSQQGDNSSSFIATNLTPPKTVTK